MNIVIADAERWEVPLFRKALKKHRLTFLDEHITEKNAAKLKNAEVISGLIVSRVSKEIIRKLPRLKMIATRSTGFDHIDLAECRKRKIVVCNVPAYGENTVAEHTFALMLALTRKIIPSVERTRRGNLGLEGLRGEDLDGKTLGVVGTGRIGRNVIRIAKCFRMNVIAYDKYPDKAFASKSGFEYVSFAKLLSSSDIITLHVPFSKETEHMINNGNVKRIKKGALLVNTARGGIVETNALIKALKQGILAGAALDVLEEECEMKEEAELLTNDFAKRCNLKTLLEQHILLDMDNVIMTPHNAFNSAEALRRIVETTIENILAFVKKKAINCVGLRGSS